MGEVKFSHYGRNRATVKFPYTDRGTRAIKRAESLVRREARAARRRGSARS